MDPDPSLFDGDGYPTDDALDRLENFAGTPHQYIEFAMAMYSGYGNISIVDKDNDFGRPIKQVRIVTGGWSGNESVVSVIERSMFSLAYWYLSKRGGLHVYEVPADSWDGQAWKTFAIPRRKEPA